MNTADGLYKEAYNKHYKSKQFLTAYNLYKEIIEKYPDSKEASYSKTQIQNLSKEFNVSEDDSDNLESKIKNKDTTFCEETDGLIISTTPALEGYKITEYIGADAGYSVFATGVFDKIVDAYVLFGNDENTDDEMQLIAAQNKALRKLCKKAKLKGGNTLVGVSFNFTAIIKTKVCVSASGTIVKAEKFEIE